MRKEKEINICEEIKYRNILWDIEYIQWVQWKVSET